MASNNSSKKVSASVPMIIKIKLKYSETAPEQTAGTKMAFVLNRDDYNFIADYNYRGAGSSVETGVLYTASASATNKLTIDDTNCFVELREATDDNLLQSLWVSEDGVPTQENHTSIPVLGTTADGKDKAEQQVTYTAEKASKDSFYIRPSQRQSGARVKVFLGDKDNEVTVDHYDAENPHIGIYKIKLDGDAYNPKGQIKIIISVYSEAQLDGSTSSTETELNYTLTVTQTYCGLDNIKVTSNENEKLNIAEDKKGLNPDYPNKDNPTTYKVRVPVGQSNGLTGATKVNIVPSVLAGYGISNSISISATNCTASASSINTNNNGNFDVTNITADSTITLNVNNSQGDTTQITIQFELISINTAIDGALKLTYGDNKEVSANNVGGNFKFELPKASEKEIDGVHVRVGDLSATLSVGATFVITQDGEEIEKVGEGDNAKYQLKAGNYAMVVTSAAGNTQSYGIYVENQSVAGDIVRFEFKTSDTDWILVFDLDEVVDSTGRDFSFDTVSKTFTLNGSTDLTDVYFRFALTDDSTLTGLTADSEIVGDGQYGTYKTYTYTYTGLTTGINKKDVKVNSNQAVGSNTYTLEVVNTEQDYQIVGIDIGNDDHNNPLINFDNFVEDSTDSSKLTYPTTIEVPFATNKVNFTINAEGHSTQVFINAIQMYRKTTDDTATGKKQTIHTREINLQDGKTTKIVITHKGTDGLVTEGTKTYTINIARKAASSDAKLAGLEIYLNEENADNTESKLNLAFDPTNQHYLIQLPEDTAVNKVFIKATASDSNATVSGSIGHINLDNISTDTYKFNIIVTPENSVNGSGKMIYTIELYAPTSDLETINTLKEFLLIGNDNVNYLTGDNQFEEAKDNYSITVPYSINLFTLIAVAKGNKATISAEMNGTATTANGTSIKLNEGNNTLKVTVTPQNTNLANPMDYIVHITRKASQGENAKLDTLQVLSSTGVDLFAGLFASNKYDYELTVNSGNQTNNLEIELTAPNGALVKITCNNDPITLGANNRYSIGTIDYGTSKTYIITVAVDDSTVTYTLKINREHKTPSLDTLVITQNSETIGLPLYDKEGKDQVSYEKGVYEYTVKISYENVTTLTINTTAQANVIDGTKEYNIDIAALFGNAAGTKAYDLIKINSGGITQQYIIYITRLANPASNVTIDNITISKLDSFKFSGDISSYGPYTVENAIDILQPKVECADANASVQIFVNGELANNNIVNLAIGENNIKIVVTAADRVTTKEVYIKVNRKHPSISAVIVTDGGNATLDTGVAINDDINAYSFTVAKDVDKINLNLGLANGYTQTIKSGDPNNLKVGEFNKIVVEVKDSNNQVVRTIEFNVFRENPADYTLWFIIAGVLGGIILILLILTVVAFTKGGKAKKKGNINDIGIGDYELD